VSKNNTIKKKVSLEGIDYLLMPNNYKNTEHNFEVKQQYSKLNQQALQGFKRSEQCLDTPLKPNHLHVLKKHLDPKLCRMLIEEYEGNAQAVHDDSVLQVLLPQVFNQTLDAQLISYFDSEYCVFWWSIYKVSDSMPEDAYFTKWHCDAGPKKHLKVIVYLNGFEEHGSDTGYLGKAETQQLKEVGYVFNALNDRVEDISPLCKHFNITFEPKCSKPEVGDCLIFNPNQVAHRAFLPQKNKERYALNFCVVQSEACWQDVCNNYMFPQASFQTFDDFAKKALKFKANSNVLEHAFIHIARQNDISNLAHVEFLLENIFSDVEVATNLYQYLINTDPYLMDCENIFDLISLSKKLLHGQLDETKSINKVAIQALLDLADYETVVKDSFSRYDRASKPDQNAIFWPNPTHEKHPGSKYSQVPFVKKQLIMNKQTPIGSAGSCFAFEIAKYFQQSGFNYVVTERNDDPKSGIAIDGYTPGDAIAKFCANYGILFNTPSFSQLAEKAFSVKRFNKLLVEDESGYYLDPYRENVIFSSPQAYLTDYEQHLAAVKASFLQSKVFVITLGLNECWQLHDGTFMSRNPRDNMYHLAKHKTLTVAENIYHIQRFFDIIKQHNPEFTLIISVSPIPFLATGRANEHHIISANCHSKAVLRVAAEELVQKNKDMYYLPSYELVTECTENAWADDQRHVKLETVKRVVSMFEDIFVEQ